MVDAPTITKIRNLLASAERLSGFHKMFAEKYQSDPQTHCGIVGLRLMPAEDTGTQEP